MLNALTPFVAFTFWVFIGKSLCRNCLSKTILDVMYMLGFRFKLLDVLRFTSEGLTPTPNTLRELCETFSTICDGDLFCYIVIDGEAETLLLALFENFFASDSTNVNPCD